MAIRFPNRNRGHVLLSGPLIFVTWSTRRFSIYKRGLGRRAFRGEFRARISGTYLLTRRENLIYSLDKHSSEHIIVSHYQDPTFSLASSVQQSPNGHEAQQEPEESIFLNAESLHLSEWMRQALADRQKSNRQQVNLLSRLPRHS